MELELQKVSEDARGKIYILKYKGKEIAHLDLFNKSAPRGGHYHPSKEIIVVLEGELEYREMDPKSERDEIRKDVRKGDIIQVEPGKAHLFVAKTDSLLLGFRKGEYKSITYEPYRKIVEVT